MRMVYEVARKRRFGANSGEVNLRFLGTRGTCLRTLQKLGSSDALPVCGSEHVS